jgi:hypothetical protein
MVGIKVGLPGSVSAPVVASAIDEVERRVRAAVPAARVIYIEPDIDRAPGDAMGADAVAARVDGPGVAARAD